MARTYHVHGPCYVRTGTGAADALEVLGMTVAGAEINVQYLRNPVRSDAAGDGPADFQAMGELAFIRFQLADYDDAVVARVLRRAMAAPPSATAGQAGKVGTLLRTGTGGNTFAHVLNFPSSLDAPWTFGTAVLQDPQAWPIGTRVSTPTLSFVAWRYVGPESFDIENTALYTRVNP